MLLRSICRSVIHLVMMHLPRVNAHLSINLRDTIISRPVRLSRPPLLLSLLCSCTAGTKIHVWKSLLVIVCNRPEDGGVSRIGDSL